jgi:hypothetical protein
MTCVLSDASYRRLTHFQAYRLALAALVAQRSLLFLGHSLADPDLRLVLDEAQELFGGGPPRHWFLGVGLSGRVQQRFLDRGVRPVEYGKDGDYSLLEPVLEFLAAAPSQGDSASMQAVQQPLVGYSTQAVQPVQQAAPNSRAHSAQPDYPRPLPSPNVPSFRSPVAGLRHETRPPKTVVAMYKPILFTGRRVEVRAAPCFS